METVTLCGMCSVEPGMTRRPQTRRCWYSETPEEALGPLTFPLPPQISSPLTLPPVAKVGQASASIFLPLLSSVCLCLSVCLSLSLSLSHTHTHTLTLSLSDVPVITFSELIHYPTKSMTATYLPGIHGDWVTRVQYCPYMDLCMSCSNDSGCSLHLVDPRGQKEGIVFSVRKGVSSFDYSRELNVIGTASPYLTHPLLFSLSLFSLSLSATGGLDRILRLWNPYIPAKPTTVLKGHTSAIVHVVLHSKYGEVKSLSTCVCICV